MSSMCFLIHCNSCWFSVALCCISYWILLGEWLLLFIFLPLLVILYTNFHIILACITKWIWELMLCCLNVIENYFNALHEISESKDIYNLCLVAEMWGVLKNGLLSQGIISVNKILSNLIIYVIYASRYRYCLVL